jgi:hypothetical protein
VLVEDAIGQGARGMDEDARLLRSNHSDPKSLAKASIR